MQLAGGAGREAVGQHSLDLGQGVQPREAGFGRFAIFQALVQLIQKIAGRPWNFAIERLHPNQLFCFSLAGPGGQKLSNLKSFLGNP